MHSCYYNVHMRLCSIFSFIMHVVFTSWTLLNTRYSLAPYHISHNGQLALKSGCSALQLKPIQYPDKHTNKKTDRKISTSLQFFSSLQFLSSDRKGKQIVGRIVVYWSQNQSDTLLSKKFDVCHL